MRDSSKPSALPPRVTLATWMSMLGPGSPCLCCCTPLRTSPVDTVVGFAYTPRLVCPQCGAEVFGEMALPAWIAIADRNAVTAAA